MGLLTAHREPCSRMLLRTRHSRRSIVQEDGGRVTLVIGSVHERPNATVKERRISNDSHELSSSPISQSLRHSMGLADAGSHAETGIQRAEGGIGGPGIAPDIPRGG